MAAPCTLDRLRELLEAYGADDARWPADEREAALALLTRSAEARAAREAGARLDGVLDLAPSAPASPALVTAVLAAAPRGRRPPRARRRLVAALPLAAAAALALWLARDRGPASDVLTGDVLAALGSYATPTDVLLASPDAVLDTLPSVGCTGTGLGCPDVEKQDSEESTVEHQERIRV